MPSHLRPRIRFGQNFLVDPRLIDRLLDASSITSADVVLEIGPGGGIITERLARRARQVLAIERDPQLAARLRLRLAGWASVRIRTGDFLEAPLPAEPYKVFASIPFNQTAAIVAKLMGAAVPPDDAYLVVQREAAERFMGRPTGTLVATLLHPWFAIDVRHRFQHRDFDPPPGVEVVLLRLAKRGPPLVK
ncbi:MAG: ribosomal RNA small subunit methyltransferase A, partial [Dehalococcoidia bacterium]